MTAARSLRRAAAAMAAAGVLTVLAGCATVPAAGAGAAAAAPTDPWENWNRKVFAFNEAVDEAVLKPVAQAYRDVVPELVRRGVGNVLGNIYDVWSAANQLLQGKAQFGVEMGMRVLTNTLFGLGGLLDPATEMGLARRSEDFGQTLGRWGLGNGPYIVLPLLGPSTLRDTAGLLADRQVAPSTLPHTDAGSYATTTLEVVHLRAGLLQTTQLLDEVSLDKYAFIRDGYLARRRDAVYDGAPPMEVFQDDGDDAPPAPAAPASAPRSAPASVPTPTPASTPASAPG